MITHLDGEVAIADGHIAVVIIEGSLARQADRLRFEVRVGRILGLWQLFANFELCTFEIYANPWVLLLFLRHSARVF